MHTSQVNTPVLLKKALKISIQRTAYIRISIFSLVCGKVFVLARHICINIADKKNPNNSGFYNLGGLDLMKLIPLLSRNF
jgi:hypothetical protein